MDRRPTTQDISWLLDLEKNGQIDLDPPYQRRSVWTMKDRRFFLDTIFRNFPSPAIFLHKDISDTGSVKYRVVDGKQRLETIFRFAKGKIRVANDFGDVRLDNKRFSDISGNTDLKLKFWNYQIPVEMIDFREAALVNNVFDRLNRNSRKLTAQELRHAKFDGWFISRAEAEAADDAWKTLGIATRARNTRMTDVQFISELMAVVIQKGPAGFSQDDLDQFYADYDDLADVDDFDEDSFNLTFGRTKQCLLDMQRKNGCVGQFASGFGAFYSLWAAVASLEDVDVNALAVRYAAFMSKVEQIAMQPAGAVLPEGEEFKLAAAYRENSRGASTEPTQRLARHTALRNILTHDESALVN